MNDRYLGQMDAMESEQREWESSQYDYYCESDKEAYEKAQWWAQQDQDEEFINEQTTKSECN